MIYDSISFEKNIEFINVINQKIKKTNENIKIRFIPGDQSNLDLLNSIKKFGLISHNNYKFKKCPINLKDNRYELNDENIITKKGANFIVAICEKELEKDTIHKWKIKIIKSKDKLINVGVAPIDIDISSPSPYNYGWFLFCKQSSLYSGKPHNYSNKKMNLKEIKDEIMLVMDMNKQTLKFIIDGEDKGESFTNIPIDKPIAPAVTLFNENDSIQLIEC